MFIFLKHYLKRHFQEDDHTPLLELQSPVGGKKPDSEIHPNPSCKKTTRSATISFLLVISLSRIGVGILNSIEGPTLPTLARHVGHPPSDLGWIFTVRSFGFILGSAIPPILRHRLDDMLGMFCESRIQYHHIEKDNTLVT